MSESALFYKHPFLQPFSFDGWDAGNFVSKPLDFGKKWVEGYIDSIETSIEMGFKENADENAKKAMWWGGLRELPANEGNDMEFAVRHNATEQIDALLERAIVSEEALTHLIILVEQIFSGLCQLAVHDNKQAAKSLVNSLCYIVDGFNDLAWDKPEAFLHATRRNQGIPGIITRFSEKTKANEKLTERLQVGRDFPQQLPTLKDGKRGNKVSVFQTPANLWASRLYMYIDYAKTALALLQRDALDLPADHPSWWQDAMKLAPFSPATCSKWAEVAWKVVNEVTNGQPEQEPVLFALQSLPAEKDSKYSDAKRGTTPKAYRKAIWEALEKAFKKIAGQNLSAT